jgi:hypothetical protein
MARICKDLDIISINDKEVTATMFETNIRGSIVTQIIRSEQIDSHQ